MSELLFNRESSSERDKALVRMADDVANTVSHNARDWGILELCDPLRVESMLETSEGVMKLLDQTEFSKNHYLVEMYAKSAIPGYESQERYKHVCELRESSQSRLYMEIACNDDGSIWAARGSSARMDLDRMTDDPSREQIEAGVCDKATIRLRSERDEAWVEGFTSEELTVGEDGKMLDLDAYGSKGDFEAYCRRDYDQAYEALVEYGFKPSWRSGDSQPEYQMGYLDSDPEPEDEIDESDKAKKDEIQNERRLGRIRIIAGLPNIEDERSGPSFGL